MILFSTTQTPGVIRYGKRAYEKSVSGDISNRVKQATEHAIQGEEERVNMEEVLLSKKKNSPLSQEIQLDIKEQKKKIHRIQGEPSVILICIQTCHFF